MEIKKSKTADLESQRPTLLLLGLIFSFGITLQSFEWLKSDVIVKPISSFEDETLYEPINEVMIAKPQPKFIASSQPKTANKGPVIVKETPKIEPSKIIKTEPKPTPTVKPIGGFDLNSKSPTTNEELETVFIDPELPFARVEVKPEFIGGAQEMIKFISKNVVYPSISRNTGKQGKVYVTFIIDKQGNVTNAEVIKGVDKHLDKEALRVINKMPKWKPGKQRGKAVRVKYTIPVNYKLRG